MLTLGVGVGHCVDWGVPIELVQLADTEMYSGEERRGHGKGDSAREIEIDVGFAVSLSGTQRTFVLAVLISKRR